MNTDGEEIPATETNDAVYSFGGSSFSVRPDNYQSIADKYFNFQQSSFGNQTENDRKAYYDTFAEIAGKATRSFTLDSTGAAVPNNQGYGYYLWETIKGGTTKSAAELAKIAPDGNELKLILYASLAIAVISLLKR